MRWAAGSAAFLVGSISLAVIVKLAGRAQRLSLLDAFAVLGVVAPAIGHFTIAAHAVKHRWPLRAPELAKLLCVIAVISMGLGIGGATRFLQLPSEPVLIRGVEVHTHLEFAAAAMFFSLPGVTLLVMCLLAFRYKTSPGKRPGAPADDSPFVVEAFGAWPASAVETRRLSARRTVIPAVARMITQTWEAELAVAEYGDRRLYDGRLARLTSIVANEDLLRLDLEQTSYRELLGTNLLNLSSAARFGDDALSHALGISAVVIVSDKQLVFGRRSDRVGFHAGCIHTFGGLVEESDCDDKGCIDVFSAIRRELLEELGLQASDITHICAMAVVRDRAIMQPELLFEVQCSLTRDDLWQRYSIATDTAEHVALEFVANRPEDVVSFAGRSNRVTPVAACAALLMGRRQWGNDWYQQSCRAAYGRIAL